jgi:hypothetical protein
VTPRVFLKHYTDPARGVAARHHRDWLEHLDSGVRIPHGHPGSANLQILEQLTGDPPGPDHLITLAATLGQLHGAAYERELHAARLDEPFTVGTGLTISDFRAGRQQLLAHFGVRAHGPAAFYKDANIRNFVITPTGPAVVDFDDLTLAPFGYDLAKLVVSAAMTYGALPADQLHDGLRAYNGAVTAAGGPEGACSSDELAIYAEIHDALTRRYRHSNGYQHAWPDIRAWPSPA